MALVQRIGPVCCVLRAPHPLETQTPKVMQSLQSAGAKRRHGVTWSKDEQSVVLMFDETIANCLHFFGFVISHFDGTCSEVTTLISTYGTLRT